MLDGLHHVGRAAEILAGSDAGLTERLKAARAPLLLALARPDQWPPDLLAVASSIERLIRQQGGTDPLESMPGAPRRGGRGPAPGGHARHHLGRPGRGAGVPQAQAAAARIARGGEADPSRSPARLVPLAGSSGVVTSRAATPGEERTGSPVQPGNCPAARRRRRLASSAAPAGPHPVPPGCGATPGGPGAGWKRRGRSGHSGSGTARSSGRAPRPAAAGGGQGGERCQRRGPTSLARSVVMKDGRRSPEALVDDGIARPKSVCEL
jgi:hypothetical protein